MHSTLLRLRLRAGPILACTVVAAAANLCVSARAAESAPAEPARLTVDAQLRHSALSAGYDDGDAAAASATLQLRNGDVARFEVLQERKFGSTGGLLVGSYVLNFAEVWSVTPTLTVGHGDRNWAKARFDLEAARKWGEGGWLVTRLASFAAAYDQDRQYTDAGWRLGLSAYLPWQLVADAGVSFNLSQPGQMRSHMPFVALTQGGEGSHYLSLRLAHGSEAYLSVGTALTAQVVFDSSTASLTWRQWLGPRWGIVAQGERYTNPYYGRTTLGGGVFLQW